MGQQSKIDRLPKAVRETLNGWLLDPSITQVEATRRTNVLLEEISHPERMDKSSVNRYALKMEEVGAKIREAREVAEVWIGQVGAKPQGQVGLFITESLRTLAFDLTMKLQGADLKDPAVMNATIGQLKALSLAVQRLEQSTSLNVKREGEIRKQALQEAAEAVSEEARAQGMDADQAEFWRKKVLGVA